MSKATCDKKDKDAKQINPNVLLACAENIRLVLFNIGTDEVLEAARDIKPATTTGLPGSIRYSQPRWWPDGNVGCPAEKNKIRNWTFGWDLGCLLSLSIKISASFSSKCLSSLSMNGVVSKQLRSTSTKHARSNGMNQTGGEASFSLPFPVSLSCLKGRGRVFPS